MSLQRNLLRGAVLAIVGGSILTLPALAQNAQFTPDSSAPIQLHMPMHLHLPAQPKRAPKRKAAKKAAPQAAPSGEAAAIPFGSAAPVTQPVAPPRKTAGPARTPQALAGFADSPSARRKAVKEVLAAPARTSSSSDTAIDVSGAAAIPFSFDSAPPPPRPPAKPKPAAAPPAKAKPNASAPSRTEVASLEPPPKETPAPAKPKGDPYAGMTKKGEVLFSGEDIEPQGDSAEALKAMAGDLNSAVDSGAVRIELEAFGGAPGEKSSESRRLALRRALSIRQLLIDKGIPATRIDVKAMGGVEDHGNADRVDVWLRGG